jgi:hypothetical protein
MAVLSRSTGVDYRRVQIGFTVIFLTFAIMALEPQFAFAKIRLFLFGVLCIIQLSIVYSTAFTYFVPPVIQALFHTIPAPDTLGEPAVALLADYPIEKLAPANIALLSPVFVIHRPLDADLLNLLLQTRGINDVRFSWPWNFETLPEGYALIHKECNYVLADVTLTPWYENDPSGRAAPDPNGHLTSDMARRWQSSTLAEVGLVPIADFMSAGEHLVILKVVDASTTVF